MDNSFYISTVREPHHNRTREILKRHPEIKKLFGRNPYTFLFILVVVGAQLAIGSYLAVTDQSWWVVLLAAYFIGAFLNNGLSALIHECAHGLVFRRKIYNMISSILCDLGNGFPTAVSIKKYHLKHHSHQGHYESDVDIASQWEAELVGNSAIKKAIWLLLFPIWQGLRSNRMAKIKLWDNWTIFSAIVIFSFDLYILIFWGPQALAYFLLSFFFCVGLHPVGARKIQQHFVVSDTQETYSYYGILNVLSFNIGYHNEHHDFPGIPWNRLPRIRAIAPEYYDSLYYYQSWTRLLLRFVFDPEITLFLRTVRTSKRKTLSEI